MSHNDAVAKKTSTSSSIPGISMLSRSMSKLLERNKRGTETQPSPSLTAAPAVPPAHKKELKAEDRENRQWVRRVERVLSKTVEDDDQCFFIHREFSEFSRGLSGQSAQSAPVDPSKSSSLHENFSSAEVRAWDPSGFELIQKLQDAVRNQGEVLLMRDLASNAQVAVKRMPATWVGSSHEDFVVKHPDESEKPWQDIGCVRFLNKIGYEYACQLLGVFRDELNTYVVSSFATEGDLHTWCSGGPKPSLESELEKQPVCIEILRAIQQLHDSSVVHGDVSLENILLSQPTSLNKDGKDNGSNGVKNVLQVKVIDFGVASACRHLVYTGGGRNSYHAPEVHSGERYDGFLADTFSIGVVLYAIMTRDYPWMSTEPGNCPCWGYVQNFGLRSFLDKRRVNDGAATAAEVLSEPLMRLLEGLLAPDPTARLTLGERCFASCGRRSVWDEPWVAQRSNELEPEAQSGGAVSKDA